MRSAVRDERHARVTLINYRKDGTPFWNEVSLSPLFDDGRAAVLHYIGFQHDVSAREVALEGLRDAEERYRRLAENLPGVVTYVAEYDGGGAARSTSRPRSRRMLGYPRENWCDDRSVWFERAPPRRPRAGDRTRAAPLRAGEPIDTEYRLLQPDGSEVWVWDKDTVNAVPRRRDAATRACSSTSPRRRGPRPTLARGRRSCTARWSRRSRRA